MRSAIGIGECDLQPVDAEGEVAVPAIVGLEGGERRARSRRTQVGESGHTIGQRHAGPNRGDEVVDDIGPDRPVRGPPPRSTRRDQHRHECCAEQRSDHREHRDLEDGMGERTAEHRKHEADEGDDGNGHAGESRKRQGVARGVERTSLGRR